MKLYIRADVDEEYIPDITPTEGHEIIDTVVEEVTECITKRYRNAAVSAQSLEIKGNKVSADIIVSNKGNLIRNSKFEFEAYSDYFDYQDYLSHMTRTIRKFVKDICAR